MTSRTPHRCLARGAPCAYHGKSRGYGASPASGCRKSHQQDCPGVPGLTCDATAAKAAESAPGPASTIAANHRFEGAISVIAGARFGLWTRPLKFAFLITY